MRGGEQAHSEELLPGELTILGLVVLLKDVLKGLINLGWDNAKEKKKKTDK